MQSIKIRNRKSNNRLYNINDHKDSCGVGFITRKDGVPTHTLVSLGHEALCSVPHRCGVDAHGVGDGGGVLVDISEDFFSRVSGQRLELGYFGVGNFFMPENGDHAPFIKETIESGLAKIGVKTLLWRKVPVASDVIGNRARKRNPTIWQVIFSRDDRGQSWQQFENTLASFCHGLGDILYPHDKYFGFFPLSLSSRTVVYKGCLQSHQVVPYFKDLMDENFKVKIFLFHTRYSTNTAPHPSMAQPFMRIAHNGELNTDKKNRIQDDSVLRTKGKRLITPKGQSDSARLDQALVRRMYDDHMGVVEAIVRMSPPAWENNPLITGEVRAMLEYYSLSEEKIDGPAALLFTDGIRVGAQLDRLGLRPLRQTETTEYICVMSEAGQNVFDAGTVISRGRIEAGGMVVFDHEKRHFFSGKEILQNLSKECSFNGLLEKSIVRFDALGEESILEDTASNIAKRSPEFKNSVARSVAYGHNLESFQFMLDPMLKEGKERVSAMGYSLAINPLNVKEGGIFRYFSQRFAQVTNPPLDSIREAEGMTLRVSLGAKQTFSEHTKQVVIDSPVLTVFDLMKIRAQREVKVDEISACFSHSSNREENACALRKALADIAFKACEKAKNNGVIVLSDSAITVDLAAVPMALCVASINRALIAKGLRFNTSLIVETGQAVSSHHCAVLLGFGASAVCATTVHDRAQELYPNALQEALERYRSGCNKALMKTMGKFGLCTIESYSGGEFFEANYLDTQHDQDLREIFPNIDSPVGGVGFKDIATSAYLWHIQGLRDCASYPNLGLFKERSEGSGHSYGILSTKAFSDMAVRDVSYAKNATKIPHGTWVLKDHLMVAGEMLGKDAQYLDFGYRKLSKKTIDTFAVTKSYRQFSKNLLLQRIRKPSALRDILAFPLDLTLCETKQDFIEQLSSYNFDSTDHATIKNMPRHGQKRAAFDEAVVDVFQDRAQTFMKKISHASPSIEKRYVQSASSICQTFASGAMSLGALNRNAHEAVALGANIVGANSNCGEGGEQYNRFNTLRASTIKQIASGRFGVWAGYLADPLLREVEIKISQGAKPGEGGQLPAKKVTVEIATMRGGTPGIELVSPPPHHDTYSIEDLAQLIHDCHCAGTKVVVKLVSSEGIGTIAVGVAKAGADVINIAGNTGGTGAAQVTSLKHTGRSSEIGIAEVHQALCDNGLRDKVILRNSGSFQNGYDVVKAAILGADSFEFGTSAMMMLGCVMAKNCNIKCPAGLTTDPDIFAGDARALAQYFINLAQEIREILAYLGFKNLTDLRGRGDLLHLLHHKELIGNLYLQKLLPALNPKKIDDPTYIQPSYPIDDTIIDAVKKTILKGDKKSVFDNILLDNRQRSVGGKTAINIERILSYSLKAPTRCVTISGKRPVLKDETIVLKTHGSAGQSYGVFTTAGMKLLHVGTCNDGVGKSMCGGVIIIKNPGLVKKFSVAAAVENVLVGNFALFGAVGGKLFVEGEAGDRFAVRNTGALGVVEGVGEFACEYMVNGTVVNLGSCGKGFGNGMSGGIAYQYDPDNVLPKKYAKDSISIEKIINDGLFESHYHQNFVRSVLQQHVTHTNSQKARYILKNWASEKDNFYCAMPLALYVTQCSHHLEKSMSQKNMIEELSKWYVVKIFHMLKSAYKTTHYLFKGRAPTKDTMEIDLLSCFFVVQIALMQARRLLQEKNVFIDDYMLGTVMKKLIITEDKDIKGAAITKAREALSDVPVAPLSIWLSQKRIDDYTQSLKNRDTQDIQNDGMIKWIEYISKRNEIETYKTGSLQTVIGETILYGVMDNNASCPTTERRSA